MGLIATGQAELVACVYGLAPSSGYIPGADPSVRSVGAAAYGYPERYDMVGAAATHALHAQWHMAHHGTTSRHLGAVAVALRDHALKRPVAWGYGRPITLDDHQASRMIVEPFRQLDCCMDTDGAVAIFVTSAERARSLPTRPVYIRGMGFGHNVRNWHRGDVYGHHDDIAPAKAKAFAQARVGLHDIDVAQLYDPFTISVIMQLEEYGFCAPGQGGPFVADGAIAADGAIPTNTCGGQLSGFYATGYTPVVEAVWQLRGEGGAGQVPGAELALVSNHGLNGGVQNTWSHCTMVLGCEP
jgi:acetyl-CoA acetyltransferase